jgi:hypothetical protein
MALVHTIEIAQGDHGTLGNLGVGLDRLGGIKHKHGSTILGKKRQKIGAVLPAGAETAGLGMNCPVG